LDAGALIAADRGDRTFWLRWAAARAQGRHPTVPASVVAQVWRGAGRACTAAPASGRAAPLRAQVGQPAAV